MSEGLQVAVKELPLWAQIRIANGYAEAGEIADYEGFAVPERRYMAGCTNTDQCSGCVSSKTGGCNPGTACLFACLQSKQK